jgi:hypothetical protein
MQNKQERNYLRVDISGKEKQYRKSMKPKAASLKR